MPDFLLPDLGEGLEDAEVLRWLVAVGDEVAVDQPVVEVETAKAAVEVPIPYAGVVSALHAQPGQVLAVGAPLISVGAEAATAAPGLREPGVAVPSPATAPAAAAPGDGAEAEADSSGSVLIGYGTSTAPRRARRGARRRPPVAAPPTAPGRTPALDRAPERAAERGRSVPVISPLVRKLARDAGLDLNRVHGSGPAGLVRRRDVELALSEVATSPQPQPARPGGTPAPAEQAPAPAARAGEQRIPLRGLRKRVAEATSRSRREIPEATVWVDVDATALLAARAALTARDPEDPVSLLALLARFCVLGLQRYPELNSRVEGDEIVLPGHVNLGFAAQTERGLVVPVVHGAERLPARRLSAALAERTAAARAGTLGPAELTGGTFTLNNYGSFGVDGSAAIINHPEVAILGVGRIIDRPWVVDGQLAVRRVGQLCLAFDHRVCDGGVAGGFLRYVADCVENPVVALGEA
ncbi:pyruvate dehydrogenase E2 component (dihydrolipoamide acetyltransferase) [Kineococcus xinjiangensis]|uniref:Dihydrolipoamide acetyltransferase component of pyruvate dehydrogenase complex n=1 Tax=Kineococcus xinjiangensis TaxID=512762 RepID=A0A2S6IK10_9ACTN|nr:dihydrolipoamide acetyltransferase family protein [Kineococcus xinjiangensis]PPK94567.1 pyruvate dehydrogenase E2 component (dihydrolipoamide acetyltransferase) [Kineococcus xinjiangensis]